MIYCNLRGGLGHQLFQLGAALRLARLNVRGVRLHLGTLGTRERFRLPDLLPADILPNRVDHDDFISLVDDTRPSILRDPDAGPWTDQPLLDIDYQTLGQHIVLDGRFQTSRNASALRNFLRRSLPDWFLAESNPAPEAEGRVAAHFRLGDRRQLDAQALPGILHPAYLDRAISRLPETLRGPVDLYSDDEMLARVYGQAAGLHVHVGGDDIAVFRRLMRAEALIAGNSTFSLMAAFLSPSITLLCRPARWSRGQLTDDVSDTFEGHTLMTQNDFLTF